MNLEESRRGTWDGLEEERGGENCVIIISKIKEIYILNQVLKSEKTLDRLTLHQWSSGPCSLASNANSS